MYIIKLLNFFSLLLSFFCVLDLSEYIKPGYKQTQKNPSDLALIIFPDSSVNYKSVISSTEL